MFKSTLSKLLSFLLIVVATLYGAAVYYFNKQAPLVVEKYKSFFVFRKDDQVSVNPWAFSITFRKGNKVTTKISPSWPLGTFTVKRALGKAEPTYTSHLSNLHARFPDMKLMEDILIDENFSPLVEVPWGKDTIHKILRGSGISFSQNEAQETIPHFVLDFLYEDKRAADSYNKILYNVKATSKIGTVGELSWREILQHLEGTIDTHILASGYLEKETLHSTFNVEELDLNLLSTVKDPELLQKAIRAHVALLFSRQNAQFMEELNPEKLTAFYSLMMKDVKKGDKLGFRANIKLPGVKYTLRPRDVIIDTEVLFGLLNVNLKGTIKMAGIDFEDVDLVLTLQNYSALKKEVLPFANEAQKNLFDLLDALFIKGLPKSEDKKALNIHIVSKNNELFFNGMSFNELDKFLAKQ